MTTASTLKQGRAFGVYGAKHRNQYVIELNKKKKQTLQLKGRLITIHSDCLPC